MHESVLQLVSEYPAIGKLAETPESARGGFSGAGVWKLATDRGTFAVRRWPKSSLPGSRILGLHKLLRHLRSSGIDYVAVPLVSASGSTLTGFDNHMWQVEPWLPGVADFAANPSPGRLSNTMLAMARWHISAAKFSPSDRAASWFRSTPNAASPAVVERLRLSADWLRGGFEELAQNRPFNEHTAFADVARVIMQKAVIAMPFVHRELSEATRLRLRLQPCLRDVWHDHVLFDADEVTGIVDPSACRTENIATDLARLLGSLIGDDRNQWQFALDCYSKYRTLSADELRLIRVLDRSATVLSPLTWLRRKYIDQQRLDEQTVLTRLQHQDKRLMVLTQSLPSS